MGNKSTCCQTISQLSFKRIFFTKWNIYDILPWETIALFRNPCTEKSRLGNVKLVFTYLLLFCFVLFHNFQRIGHRSVREEKSRDLLSSHVPWAANHVKLKGPGWPKPWMKTSYFYCAEIELFTRNSKKCRVDIRKSNEVVFRDEPEGERKNSKCHQHRAPLGPTSAGYRRRCTPGCFCTEEGSSGI